MATPPSSAEDQPQQLTQQQPQLSESQEPIISKSAALSIARQNKSFLSTVNAMSLAEQGRTTKLNACTSRSDRAKLEKRFAGERSEEILKIGRMKDETARITSLANQGLYHGTSIGGDDNLGNSGSNSGRKGVQSITWNEDKGMNRRGGLTSTESSFLQEVYKKFEEPKVSNRGGKKGEPDIHYYRTLNDQKATRNVENQHLSLLNDKKALLIKLGGITDMQSSMVRNGEWDNYSRRSDVSVGSSRSYDTSRSSMTTSSMNTARSNQSNRSNMSSSSMASFRGKQPVNTYTTKASIQRPGFVPKLF